VDIVPENGDRPIPSLWAASGWLALAVGIWCLGGAWWSSGFLGPLHWVGGVMEVIGVIATIGAMGLVWSTVRSRRSLASGDRSVPRL